MRLRLKTCGSMLSCGRADLKHLLLKDEPRDVVIEAFIQDATITPKGSPTYFYDVFRKFKRDQPKAESKPADPSQ